METPGRGSRAGRAMAAALAAACLAARPELPVLASDVEEDHQLSMEFVTPHTKWAQPYAGGTNRVLVFIDGDGIKHWSQPYGTLPREIIELKQRFELDAAAVYWVRILDTKDEDWLHGTNGVQRMLDLLTESWDCYVLYQIPLERLPAAAQATLLANVNAGSGLVGVGTNDNGVLIETNLLASLPEFLAEGTPFLGLPFVQDTVLEGLDPEDWTDAEAAQRMMSAYGVGSGRGVRIIDRPQLGAEIGWDTEYEYWIQLLGRTVLWAAGQEPEMTLTVSVSTSTFDRAELSIQEITVEWVHTNAPPGLQIETSLRRFDGEVTPLQVNTNVAGTGTFTRGVPDLRADRYFVDVRARGTNGEQSWASTTFEVTSTRGVASVALDAYYSEIGGTISGDVSLAGAPLADELVRIDLVDSRNRIVARSDFGAGGGPVAFEFDVEEWMPMLTRVVARLLSGGQEVDHEYAYFHVTKRHRGRFNFVIWDWPMGTLAPWAQRALAQYGVTVQLESYRVSPPSFTGNPHNYVAANEIAWMPYTIHIWNALNENGIMAETGCWNDPALTGPRVNQLAENFRPSRQHGVFAYSVGDEIAVRGSCLSSYCLSAYREYLEQEYGSIAALNTSWGSSYNSFDEVQLLGVKDNDGATARSQGIYARWYDRQAFQCYNICRYYRAFGDAYSGMDPQAWNGFEGAGQFLAGDDFDLIIRTNQWWAPVAGLGDEVIRSLAPQDFPRWNWMGYQKTAEGLIREYWRMVTRGSHAIGWFMWYLLGDEHHGFLAPWLGQFDATKELLADTAVVRNGLGTLLINSQRIDDGIAILYSHPSAHATRVEMGPLYSWYDSMHSFWVRTLRELHLEFRYFTDRMLRQGEFDPASAKVLLLAQAEAIGPVEAAAIRDFVEDGGTVIADVRPGIYTERCKPRSDSVLTDLFGIEPTGEAPVEVCAFWGTANEGQTTNWSYSTCLSGVGPGMYSIAASNLSPNTAYYYIARASNAFAETWTTVQSFVTAGDLPFNETFDARSLGSLDWQNGWRADPSAAAQVEATNGIDQICSLKDGGMWHSFSGPDTTNIVWVDLSMIPVHGHGPDGSLGTATNPAAVAFYVREEDGHMVVFDGTNAVALTNKPAIPSNLWTRFTVRADYGNKQWDLYVNDTNVAQNLGFYSSAAEGILRLQCTSYDDLDRSALIDDIYVGTTQPGSLGGGGIEFGAQSGPDTNAVPGAPVIADFEATSVTHDTAWFSLEIEPIRPAAPQQATATIAGPFGNATLNGVLCDPGVFVADGTNYGTAGDIPVAIVKDVGAGRAVLLNFSMAGTPDPLLDPDGWGEYHKYYSYHSWIAKAADPQDSAQFLGQLLAWAGVEPALQIRDEFGARSINLEVTRWQNGQIQIISLYRFDGGDGEDALIELPAARYVYNLRSGADLGQTASVTVPILTHRATFLVLAPEAAPDVELELSTDEPERGEVVRLTATVPGAAGLHALRVRVKTPDGEVAEWLNTELMVDGGGRAMTCPWPSTTRPDSGRSRSPTCIRETSRPSRTGQVFKNRSFL